MLVIPSTIEPAVIFQHNITVQTSENSLHKSEFFQLYVHNRDLNHPKSPEPHLFTAYPHRFVIPDNTVFSLSASKTPHAIFFRFLYRYFPANYPKIVLIHITISHSRKANFKIIWLRPSYFNPLHAISILQDLNNCLQFFEIPNIREFFQELIARLNLVASQQGTFKLHSQITTK